MKFEDKFVDRGCSNYYKELVDKRVGHGFEETFVVVSEEHYNISGDDYAFKTYFYAEDTLGKFHWTNEFSSAKLFKSGSDLTQVVNNLNNGHSSGKSSVRICKVELPLVHLF